jgi:hypothetical protein
MVFPCQIFSVSVILQVLSTSTDPTGVCLLQGLLLQRKRSAARQRWTVN